MDEKDNPDRILIAQALGATETSVSMRSSPLLIDLSCVLRHAEPGRIKLSFEPSAQHVQGGGVIAGGTVATMLDFGMAFAGLTKCAAGESAATLSLSTQFLLPTLPGQIEVEGWLTSAAGRVLQAQAHLFDAQGQTLATAQSTLARMKLKS